MDLISGLVFSQGAGKRFPMQKKKRWPFSIKERILFCQNFFILWLQPAWVPIEKVVFLLYCFVARWLVFLSEVLQLELREAQILVWNKAAMALHTAQSSPVIAVFVRLRQPFHVFLFVNVIQMHTQHNINTEAIGLISCITTVFLSLSWHFFTNN